MTATHYVKVWCRPWQREPLRVALRTIADYAREDSMSITWVEDDKFWTRGFKVTGTKPAVTFAFQFFRKLQERGNVVVFTTYSGVERLNQRNVVEYDGVTLGGLRAAVLMVPMGHRCGYVGVGKDHPLYGAHYGVSHPALAPIADNEPVGKRSPIIVLCTDKAGLASPSPETAFDVHGGITYSGRAYWHDSEEANEADKYWYFGFDAAHCDDAPAPDSEMAVFNREFDAAHPEFAGVRRGVHRDRQYMLDECDRLAEQLNGTKVRKPSLLGLLLYPLRVWNREWGHKKFWMRSRLAYHPWVAARPKLQKFIRGF